MVIKFKEENSSVLNLENFKEELFSDSAKQIQSTFDDSSKSHKLAKTKLDFSKTSNEQFEKLSEDKKNEVVFLKLVFKVFKDVITLSRSFATVSMLTNLSTIRKGEVQKKKNIENSLRILLTFGLVEKINIVSESKKILMTVYAPTDFGLKFAKSNFPEFEKMHLKDTVWTTDDSKTVEQIEAKAKMTMLISTLITKKVTNEIHVHDYCETSRASYALVKKGLPLEGEKLFLIAPTRSNVENKKLSLTLKNIVSKNTSDTPAKLIIACSDVVMMHEIVEIEKTLDYPLEIIFFFNNAFYGFNGEDFNVLEISKKQNS